MPSKLLGVLGGKKAIIETGFALLTLIYFWVLYGEKTCVLFAKRVRSALFTTPFPLALLDDARVARYTCLRCHKRTIHA